jgi:hypothetical protein
VPDDPSGRSPSAADNLHPAHPDGAAFVAVEPEADRIRAPAIDAVTVEVVEKIKGSVTAGGVRTIKAVPRLPAAAAGHRQPRGFVLHALQGTSVPRQPAMIRDAIATLETDLRPGPTPDGRHGYSPSLAAALSFQRAPSSM